MDDPTFRGYRPEPFMDTFDLTDATNVVAGADLICQYGGAWEETGASLPESLHQGAIVEFPHQTRR